jgi:hypothetical protein
MQDITEQPANLEQDGKQYAHFLTHPQRPDYYAVWVREKTSEYIQLCLQQSSLAGYTLALSIEMPDATFVDYISEFFHEQMQLRNVKNLYHIKNLTLDSANQLAADFPVWKQEKIRLHRVKWLEQFPWVVSTQIG